MTRLLAEIRAQGYTGSANLLVRYLNQGRAHGERAAPPPRRLVSWIMTRPAELPDHERAHVQDLLTACPPLTVLAEHVRAFAELLTTRRGGELEQWMSAVEAADLPALHAFARGLRKDLPAVVAGLSQPYSNGPIERREHQGQTPETTDVRTSGLPTTTPTDPARLTRRTTSSAQEREQRCNSDQGD